MKLHRLICGIVAAATFVAGGAQRAAAKHIDDADAAKSLAAAHAAANGDPLLEALLTELERSKAQLKMDQARTYGRHIVSLLAQSYARFAAGRSSFSIVRSARWE